MQVSYKVLLVLLILQIKIASSQTKSDSIIRWNDNAKLKWDDFKGSNIIYENHAESVTGIFWEHKISEAKLTFQIYSYFDPHKSWCKEGQNTLWLLQHEQLHFDITEVYARKLKKRIKNFNFTYSNFTYEFDSIFISLNEELWKYHDIYDLETSHSKNVAKQQEWELKINNELSELKNFAGDTIILILKK